MASKKNQAGLSAALAAAAAAAYEDGQYADLDRVLAEEIAKTASGKQILQLIFDPALDASSLGDDGFGAPVAKALVASAQAFSKPADKALALAVAVRLCSANPGANTFVGPQAGDENKALFRGGLAECADALRALTEARAAGVKIAASSALAVVGTDRADVALLLPLVTDKDRVVAATALLGAAVIAARIQEAPLVGRVAEAASAVGAKEPLLVRCVAAVVLSILEQAAPAELVESLVDALTSSELLPVAWGWFASEIDGKPATLSALAARFVTAVPSARRREVVKQLAAKPRIDAEQAALLVQIAFPDGAGSGLGVEPDTLDESQTSVLWLFTKPPLATQRGLLVPLGYQHGSHLKLLLEAVAPSWKPLSVQVRGERRQWPPVLILRGVLYGELTWQAALTSLVNGLSDDEAIALLGDSLRTGVTSHPGRGRATDDQYDPVQELLLGLWQWLENERGHSADELEQRVGKDAMTAGLLLLWHATLGQGGGGAPTPELGAKIDSARRLARGPEPFQRLIATLSKSTRSQLGL